MKKKIIAIMLCIAMLCMYIPSITAADSENISETADNATQSTATLLSSDIPESISNASVAEKQHIARRYDLESDLNTAIFENADGKNTAYIFSAPIKYVDESGNIKDKSTTISASNAINSQYAYAAEDNNIKTYYPASVSDGVALNFNSYSIEFYPYYAPSNAEIMSTEFIENTVAQLSTTTSISDNKNTNRISYNRAFGANTGLQYTPTLSGVKEDIILYTYTGTSEFRFIYQTNGVSLIKEDNTVYLTDTDKNIKLGYLSDIICYDSNGNMSVGTISVSEIKAAQQYIVTVTVDSEFLTSSNTAYPVYIDPTTTIYEYDLDATEDSEGIIIDKGIYEKSEVADYISTNMINVGAEYELSDGNTRMLFALTSEYVSNSFISTLDENNFSSAALNVYTQVGEYNATVTAYQYNSTWADGSVAYCTATEFDNYNSSIYDTTTLTGGTVGICAYDITNIVGYWINGSSTLQRQGLILINANEGAAEDGEYLYLDTIENPAHETYITIDYGDKGGEYYLLNKEYGYFLTTNSSYSLTSNTYAGTTYQKWVVNYIGDNKYTIASAANENKLLYYTGSTVGMATKPSVLTTSYQWTISAATGGTIIKNVASNKVLHQSSNTAVDLITTPSSTSTDYDKCVWRTLDTASFVNLTNFSISASSMNAFSTQTCGITATPSTATLKNASDFTWSSSNTSIIEVSETGVLTSYSTGGSVTITATHKSTGISESKQVTVVDSAITIEDGLYTIEATSSLNNYIYSYSSYVNVEKIADTSYKTNSDYGNFVWYIKQYSESEKTYLIYSMSNISNYNENNQVLTYSSGSLAFSSDTSISDTKLWKFYGTGGNAYIKNFSSNTYISLSNDEIIMSSYQTGWILNSEIADTDEINDHCYRLIPVNYAVGKEVIYIINDLTDGAFSGTLIEDGVKMWNGITNKISIYMSDEFNNEDAQQAISDGKIIVYVDVLLHNFGSEDIMGRAQIYTPLGTKYELGEVANYDTDVVFSKCEMLLNNAGINGLSSDRKKKAVVAHEMGHLLTLRHIETTGGEYPDETTMLSIMNYDLSTELDNNRTYTPSWLDKHNIIQKWG
ncbi:MAG: Ig-like domain-containing protein [Clostridia bacterium]|nr:Ig-like domain-containing protein [Clostridia bacterium]